MSKCDKQDIYDSNALIQALDNINVLMFMYYPQRKTVVISERTSQVYQCKRVYEDMPQSFAEDIVYEGDYHVFNEMYRRIDSGEGTASSVFHSKDMKYCAKVTLTTVKWTQEGKPEEAIGLCEDRSDLYNNEKLVYELKKKLTSNNPSAELDDALKTMATAIGRQYFAVYYIWLDSRTYVCFQEQLQGILDVIGSRGLFEPAWDAYINGYIEEDYHEGIRAFIDINTLAERIGSKSSITYNYKRKEIGWTRGQFIAGERDENGKPLTVIYTVSDINEEIEGKQRQKQAEIEALQDDLTGLWNRKAFDLYKKDEAFRCNKAGILLFDIDRFKVVNDQYGHDEGDSVLVTVAQEVRAILRHNDVVCRIGGDEFAVLLYNCDASIWHIICHKIETIHADVKEILPEGMNVTISAGLCVNENGYCDEMFSLADKALYNTKANGRGGCTMINLNGEILHEWHDHSNYLRKGEVLEKNSTVTWRMEIPKRNDVPARLYGDDLYMEFLGIRGANTPEEVFRAGIGRLDSEYVEIVNESVISTVKIGHAEAIYMWNHPEKGKIQLRCSSSLDYETEEMYSLVGYLHLIDQNTHVFTLEDVNRKIQSALEELYFCNFYVKLSDYSFKVYKAQEYMMDMLDSSVNAMDAVNKYVANIVADESREEMSSFLDLSTIKHRMENTNILGANYYDPNIGWSRAVFIAVDRNAQGEVETVDLVVEGIANRR